MTKQSFYDFEQVVPELIVRYAIGGQEREAHVLANGHTLEAHTERLESLAEPSLAGPNYVQWTLVAGGQVSIRLDAIVAIEAPERTV
ncbi:hypothetical protein M877_39965 (plasmid) [Streptomyces niveus NCIMB 11891]|nr:hypothetical protein M877_39965 [Streptomyces niveus NCIMB 11891]